MPEKASINAVVEKIFREQDPMLIFASELNKFRLAEQGPLIAAAFEHLQDASEMLNHCAQGIYEIAQKKGAKAL